MAQLWVLHQKLTPASLQLLKYEPVGLSVIILTHVGYGTLAESLTHSNSNSNSNSIAGVYFSLSIIHEWWSITYLPILLLILLAILILIINGYLNCSTAYVGEFKICLHAHHKFWAFILIKLYCTIVLYYHTINYLNAMNPSTTCMFWIGWLLIKGNNCSSLISLFAKFHNAHPKLTQRQPG